MLNMARKSYHVMVNGPGVISVTRKQVARKMTKDKMMLSLLLVLDSYRYYLPMTAVIFA